ncbi:hypothetical protein HZP84_03180 [Elizabethkingia anophelis]|nr:hypothetical protein [Elizabethkingia anophelis]MCT3821875.1 hypothetical protein [Elizabethkingia anophelis]MCT3929360.1 hypothetical protein [Elizabethkingia anophelis]MCT4075349.1 hypothetical protein [Elizabethkingia anophelis]MCT4079131.1 hypothetical protein [Elizabethkingia anophelis]
MNKKQKVTNKEIHDLIMELGSELADHDHQWSNELRKKFEDVTSYLSKCQENLELHQLVQKAGGLPVKISK